MKAREISESFFEEAIREGAKGAKGRREGILATDEEGVV
jgi:hypothetical protein